jgi:hypothetical protein
VQLELSTVLVQWAAGGLLCCWITTRRNEVGLGYGWLVRGIFSVLAIAGAAVGWSEDGTGSLVRTGGAVVMAIGACAALAVSASPVVRRTRRFDSRLDLLAPIAGLVAVAGASAATGVSYPLALVRLEVGAVLLGAVTTAMLLGHWYLVQPGLSRAPVRELVALVAVVWPVEVLAYLWPTGIVSVWNGSIDDGYGGLLGWMWAVSALTTIGLVVATWLALRERAYSAVMAATGLLYLAILTGAGTDLLARALLA